MMHDKSKGYIIVDTEGTGLFTLRYPEDWPVAELRGKTMPSDLPGQPRMAEFACVLADSDLEYEDSYKAYIRPNNWQHADGSPMFEMPEAAFKIHGLSTTFLHEHGIPAEEALQIYIKAINDGRAVLGFNQQHDGRQVRAELRHAGLDDMFERTPTVCAMRSMSAARIKIKKLNGKGGYAGLVDACAHFGVHHPPEVRHGALADAKACREVSQHINDLGILLPAEVHYAKDYQGERT